MKKTLFSLSVCVRTALVGGALLVASGCATTATRTNRLVLKGSEAAADQLAAGLSQVVAPGTGGVIAATLVSVDNMESSSSFGRAMSEQIASALSRPPHNFPVTEVKLRQNIFLKEDAGEFLLSRDTLNVSKEHEAQAVMVGTYAIGHQAVFVSVRMVSPQTNQILSSSDFSMELDDNVRTLLGYRRIHRPGWWKRLWGDRDVWSRVDRGYYEFFPDYL